MMETTQEEYINRINIARELGIDMDGDILDGEYIHVLNLEGELKEGMNG